MTERKPSRTPHHPLSTMLTTSGVARILRVHESTVRRWSDKGILKSYRIGPRGERRYRREDVAVLYLDKAIERYLKVNRRRLRETPPD
jgi:excisionase family DNA binding protein